MDQLPEATDHIVCFHALEPVYRSYANNGLIASLGLFAGAGLES